MYRAWYYTDAHTQSLYSASHFRVNIFLCSIILSIYIFIRSDLIVLWSGSLPNKKKNSKPKQTDTVINILHRDIAQRARCDLWMSFFFCSRSSIANVIVGKHMKRTNACRFEPCVWPVRPFLTDWKLLRMTKYDVLGRISGYTSENSHLSSAHVIFFQWLSSNLAKTLAHHQISFCQVKNWKKNRLACLFFIPGLWQMFSVYLHYFVCLKVCKRISTLHLFCFKK